jgi:ACS family tartrate transporter-like MFS transporter
MAKLADEFDARVLRRVTWRLLPLLMVSYFIAYVDRVNVGFAALQMNQDLHLSASVFGLGGGIFFLSYFLFEVPSNLALEKFGARRWIARVMISWGLVSAAMVFVVGPTSLLAVRFLLGVAEAGFFPGVILYLTYWFPAEQRARIVAIFMVALPLSSFIGSPISAALLGLHGWLGVKGWHWLFVAEAVPAVLLGIVFLLVMPDRPADARWLPAAERAWLVARLDAERDRARPLGHMTLWQVLRNKYVLVLALVYAGGSAASSGLSIWQPQIIKSFGLSDMQTGLLNMIPFGVASIAMILWGRASDRAGERVWNTAVPLALVALALGSALLIHALAPVLAILTVALIGTYAMKGPFWALTSEWLPGTTAAAGIAWINALGNLSGFAGTWLLGVIKDATGSFALALLPLVTLAGIGAVAVLLCGRHQAASATTSRAPARAS